MGEGKRMEPLARSFAKWLTGRNKLVGEGKNLGVADCEAIWGEIRNFCGKYIYTMKSNNMWIRLSVEHIASVLNQDFEYELVEFRARTKATMKDYLLWKRSSLGKATVRLGQQLVDEWAATKYAVGVKKLIELLQKKGSIKAATTLFKSIGKEEGSPVSGKLPTVEWIKNYRVTAGGEVVPQEMQVKVTETTMGDEEPKYLSLVKPPKLPGPPEKEEDAETL